MSIKPEVIFYRLKSAHTYEPNELPYPDTGERRWVLNKGRGWPRILPDGSYIYTVTPDGEVRFSEHPRPTSQMHHPELVHGKEVIAAGMMNIQHNIIVAIDNESGHYAPDEDSVLLALQHYAYGMRQYQMI